MTSTAIGVLVMAYGGPNDLSEVEPYLMDVRGGRPLSAHAIEEVRERYRQIGGHSPILEHTRAQADALEKALNELGAAQFKTSVGMQHWHPYIKEALDDLTHMDISRLPGYLDALADRVRSALQRVSESVRASVPILFTAHSLPQRILEWGDPYPDELRATVAALMERLGPQPHEFAFQSAAMTPDPWLGPDAGEVIARLASEGHRHVLVAPIGFVTEHVEILYDVDIDLRRRARECGVLLERIEMLNTAPGMITGLAALVRDTAAERGWL